MSSVGDKPAPAQHENRGLGLMPELAAKLDYTHEEHPVMRLSSINVVTR